MAAAAATTANHLLHTGRIQSSPFSCRQSDKIFAGGFCYAFPMISSSKSLMILASRKDDSSFNIKVTPSDPAPFNSQGEDVKYVLKLAGGSVLGAAVIKYGSALFPDITTPNILLALSMISGPVILAVLLLIKESREAN
ncbi:Glycosyltransferase-like domain-containing protein 1 [Heracleum sosnowskyi]|uniref:Glycosyltransferase-like domain-containing protein 1 n=1 Tax=Heracleum sosnowskyi TaxID=360622 RepID=A0AAD8M317_9APIA|nr:Glycosyltransferase-like domain-containing protein 1 [Heracleum sosnowskyi]